MRSSVLAVKIDMKSHYPSLHKTPVAPFTLFNFSHSRVDKSHAQ